MFRQHEPAAVVLDIDMPVLDGAGAARAIGLAPSRRPPVPLALTALSGHETRRLAFDAGADAHVSQPADIGALLELTEKLRSERA